MKPQLSLGLSQRITMTPQLVQSIRLLQLSAFELERELLDALEDNVLLEREEEDLGRAASEDARLELTAAEPEPVDVSAQWDELVPEVWASVGRSVDDSDPESRWAAPEISDPRGRILQQLAVAVADPVELAIALVIVDAVDDSGYLRETPAQICATLADEVTVSAAEVERVLTVIQRLEPVGFAARTLRECLLRQLEDFPADTAQLALARRMVEHHLDDLAFRDGADLVASLQAPIADIAQAVALIHRLNPKPGAVASEAVAIIPDLVVRQEAGRWLVTLNSAALPRVRVNEGYERVISEPASGASQALKDQMQEARWLVRSVQMRQETMLAVGQAIFTHQCDFLRRGEEGLKALTLKEVADAVGVHESTVSRITTSKYVQTPRGVYALKAFFPSQLSGAQGVNASGAAVKAMIRRMIKNEAPDQPLRDVDIAAILARRGVRVARRTVAKYREALGIASSKERQLNHSMRWSLARGA